MINIYGPQDSLAKSSLWNRIADFMHHHKGKFILFGDMNVVRNENESFGSIFSQIEADHFNSFIGLNGLIDLPIGGRLYTWMNKAGTKLSKLDQFLISDELYNSWLSRDGSDDVIKASWSSLENNNNDGRILKSHEKLRSLKASIKQWYVNINNIDRNRKHDAMSDVKLIEKRIDDGIVTPSDRDTSMQLLQEIDKLDNFKALDLIQKTHIKWDI
ncbi:RNA-directed DNA polymerase, eukaryota, reverse transcriptase zinc-binding domain protein [Tanacetum coccineum]